MTLSEHVYCHVTYRRTVVDSSRSDSTYDNYDPCLLHVLIINCATCMIKIGKLCRCRISSISALKSSRSDLVCEIATTCSWQYNVQRNLGP